MSAAFTISAEKLAANRANAQHSTGPKTKEGKAKVAQNASSHRIFSPFLLHEGDDETLFVSFRDKLLEDLFPQTFLELAAADRIISLHWKLRRLEFAEFELNSTQNQQFQKQLKSQLEIIENKRERHLDRCEEMGIDCTEEDLAEIGLSLPDPNSPPLIPQSGYFLAQSLQTAQANSTRFTTEERLLNFQSKLHSLLSKALKDYRQLQKDRQKQEEADSQQEDDGREPFCPFLTPPGTTDDEEKCEIKPNEEEEQKQTDDEQDDDPTPGATPVHTAPQSATFPPTNHQIKPNKLPPTQSPPNSFGGFPPIKEK